MFFWVLPLLAFHPTSSARSSNVAKWEFPSIVLTGRDGGKVVGLADYCIIASGKDTSSIQEVHMVLYHSLCACVEEALFPS